MPSKLATLNNNLSNNKITTTTLTTNIPRPVGFTIRKKLFKKTIKITTNIRKTSC